MNKVLSISCATALALSLAACGPKAEQKTDAAMNTTGDAMAAAGEMASNAAQDVKEAVTPTPTGQEFANTAAKSDAFEIAAAKLAAASGASTEVKKFAAEMITAHTASTAKIKTAAAAASPAITPDATLTEDQNEDLAKLKGLKGADFDTAYVDGQIDAHEDALSLMQGYAKDGEVASLKTAAGEIAPTVSKHLEMVKMLKK
jgi:putative membrane protein